MKQTILFVFIILFPSIIAAAEISLSLDEALAIALRDNRDILLKREDIKKAKEKISEAKGGLFPSLNFTGTWADTRGLYAKDIASVKTQATLKQYLYKGGKIINTIKYDKYGLSIAEALLDKAKLETLFSAQKAFYTFLLAQEFSRLNKEILDNVKAHLSSLQLRYQNGQASESDILNIKKSMSNIEEVYEDSLNQVEASQALLKNLLYLEDNITISAQGEFFYEQAEIVYDEAFLKAMKTRPEIRQYEAKYEADKKSIELAKSESRPAIYASWDYYSSSISSLTFSPAKAWNDYNVAGISFSWPIFDGWATKAKVEQAIVDLKETELSKQKIFRDIALELKNAYLSLKSSIAGLKTAESDLETYKDNLSQIIQKHRDGIASSLDLDDAGLSYKVSMFNQKQAIYDYIIAKAGFDKAAGGL